MTDAKRAAYIAVLERHIADLKTRLAAAEARLAEARPGPLDHELAVYRERHAELWRLYPGRWVIIKGDAVHEPVDSFDEALKLGYGTYGDTSFLVRQIEAVADPVIHV